MNYLFPGFLFFLRLQTSWLELFLYVLNFQVFAKEKKQSTVTGGGSYEIVHGQFLWQTCNRHLNSF